MLDRIGAGNFGEVWRARQLGLGREVAVKLMTGRFGREDRLRFEREAKAAAALDHPGIVGVHRCGVTEGGRPYLVMDLVRGESGTNVGRGLDWFQALVEAVAHAHSRGVVHRDLKPDNVLAGPGGRPVVTDFGMAKVFAEHRAETLTKSGVILGSPEYMAPEQIDSAREAGPAADVWSLGVILYERLTGRRPFEGNHPMVVLRRIVTQEPELEPLPEALRPIVARCLAKDPAARYADAGELAAALRGEMRNAECEVRSAGGLRPDTGRSAFRVPRSAFFAVVVLAVFGSVVAYRAWNRTAVEGKTATGPGTGTRTGAGTGAGTEENEPPRVSKALGPEAAPREIIGWEELGGSASGEGLGEVALGRGHLDLALLPDGRPVLAWEAGSEHEARVRAAVWTGQRWDELGIPEVPGSRGIPGPMHWPALAVHPDGRVLLAWIQRNVAGEHQIYLAAHGSEGPGEWSELGGSTSKGGVSDTWGNAFWEDGASEWPAVAVDGQGRVLVAWKEERHDLFLKRFDGKAWEELAGSASGWGVARTSALLHETGSPGLAAGPQGEVVLAWQHFLDKGGPVAIYLKRFDGSAPQGLGGSTWQGLGGSDQGEGLSGAWVEQGVPWVAIDRAGRPVVVWSRRRAADGTAGRDEVHLKRWNGSAWEKLADPGSGDGLPAPAGGSDYPVLDFDARGEPLVLRHAGAGLLLSAWEGSRWQDLLGAAPLGASVWPGGGVGQSDLATDPEGRPIVAWVEAKADRHRIFLKRAVLAEPERKAPARSPDPVESRTLAEPGIPPKFRFEASPPIELREPVACIAAADFDGDGRQDLVVGLRYGAPGSLAADRNAILTFRGRGDGTFDAPVRYDLGGRPPWALVPADLLDRWPGLDILVTSDSSDQDLGALFIWSGDGSGFFEGPVRVPALGNIRQPAVADLNGDGRADIAVPSSSDPGDGRGAVYHQRAGGIFEQGALWQEDMEAGPSAVATADLDADGFQDLLVADHRLDRVRIHFSDGAGAYTEGPELPTSKLPRWLGVADFNGDGAPDFVTLNVGAGSRRITLYINGGDGRSWTRADGELPGGTDGSRDGGEAVAIGDFDGDGRPDLLLPHEQSPLLWNDGRGGLVPAEGLDLGPDPCAVTAADLDGDGKLDLAVTSPEQGTIRVFLNRGVESKATVAADGAPREIIGWEELGGSASGEGIGEVGPASGVMDLALAPDGRPVLAWRTGPEAESRVRAAVWTGERWNDLGQPEVPGGSRIPGPMLWPAVAVDGKGRVLLAWDQHEVLGERQIYLAVHDGEGWSELGGSATKGGVSDTWGGAFWADGFSEWPALAVDVQGRVLVAWTEERRDLYLKRWNGRAWEELAGSASGPGVARIGQEPWEACGTGLAAGPDGKVFLAWRQGLREGSSGRAIYLKRYDGETWHGLGGSDREKGLSGTLEDVGPPMVVLDRMAKPLVVWSGYQALDQGDEVHLKRWNGSVWVGLDGQEGSGGSLPAPFGGGDDVAVLDARGNPVLVRRAAETGVVVSIWDGSRWKDLEGKASPGATIRRDGGGHLATAIDREGRLVIAWVETEAGRRFLYLKRAVLGR